MNHSTRLRIAFRGIALILLGCTGIPAGLQPVDGFDAGRYLGKWYEIARLDHSFERGLTNVTAEYSLLEGGGVQVINRGYSERQRKWKQARGKAYFVQGADRGFLKVSFFGPFYGSYVIFELDQEHYQYALVSGPDTSYLWILARSPDMDKDLLRTLIAKASQAGFDTSGLILVRHD
ncbi:MAG TPA: lipocalin family protein [Deltaproteobacteria bacterium]|nr:lipocalin family protein [Deltaproteobacteria bacterium]